METSEQKYLGQQCKPSDIFLIGVQLENCCIPG